MKRYNYHLILMLLVIFFTIFLWLVGEFDEFPRQDINCKLHHDFFNEKITDGRVKEKFIDYNNHGYKIVKIENGDDTYEVHFDLEENNKDFEKLEVSDIVNKSSNSFILEVNEEYTVKLGFTCLYDTIPSN
ncbi:hypothetical protein [Echinicola vietnamensis]|nr:hypothetical protein [Echinicola vietnamensis]